MDVPKTTEQCPVDHGADGSTTPEPAAIPATSLPGPKLPAPLQVYQLWKHPADFMLRCYERYGSRFVLNIRYPPKPLYVITDHEELKQTFLAPLDVLHTGLGSSTLEKFTGQTGLAWLEEDEHTVRRRYILPSVRGKAFERIQASIVEMVPREVAAWPRGRMVAMHPLFHKFTVKVIGEVLFGSAMPRCWSELLEVIWGMLRVNDHFVSVMMIHQMPAAAVRLLAAIPSTGLGEFLKLRVRADALIAAAIEERRSSGELGDDYLGVLLAIDPPVSGQEVRDELMTIFLAGTETTASGLSWACEYLTREHAALERLVAEIDAGEGDAYLTAVVHEVLRMRPPLAQVIGREVMKPIVIGGVRYEPGMILLPSPFLAHRNPSLYPDPHEFRPERWLGKRPGVYTWIPFGGGPTRCLGDQIGSSEMKVMLRELLTQCDLRRDDPRPERARSRIVLTVPENGPRLELRARPAAVPSS